MKKKEHEEMSTPTLEFLDDFPPDLEREIRKLITPMLRLVSRELVNLRFTVSSGTEIAEISVMRRYHTASVWISSGFFLLDEAYKRKTLIHELMHVLVDSVHKFGQQLIDAYFDEETSEHSFIRVRFEESAEELTDALALAFLDILEEVEEVRETLRVEAFALSAEIRGENEE